MPEPHNPAPFPPAFPWLDHLDHDDRRTFFAELAAAASGQLDPTRTAANINETIHCWRVTAETLADPDARAALTTPDLADYGPVEPPEERDTICRHRLRYIPGSSWLACDIHHADFAHGRDCADPGSPECIQRCANGPRTPRDELHAAAGYLRGKAGTDTAYRSLAELLDTAAAHCRPGVTHPAHVTRALAVARKVFEEDS